MSVFLLVERESLINSQKEKKEEIWLSLIKKC